MRRLLEWAAGRKKPLYIPAEVNVEGGGVRRGLTAPEAAVLLGHPRGMGVALSLVDLLQRGNLAISRFEPMVFEICEDDGSQFLYPYEEPILRILEAQRGQIYDPAQYTLAGQALERMLEGRMAGYDPDDTREYYRQWIIRAETEINSAGRGSADARGIITRNLTWLLAGSEWKDYLAALKTEALPAWWSGDRVQLTDWLESLIANVSAA